MLEKLKHSSKISKFGHPAMIWHSARIWQLILQSAMGWILFFALFLVIKWSYSFDAKLLTTPCFNIQEYVLENS